MITQRDLDIATIEAKLKSERLFQEWRKSYLGRRAEVQDGGRQGNGIGAEDSEAADAEDFRAPE